MTFRLTNSSRWWIAAACALLLLLIVPSPAAHADGGAPNLAYVSGTAKDVSVIDVAAQKVTRTLNTPATPSMILLSLDARFLYVTQPQANKVTILAAKTGETICSANVPGHPTLLALDQSSSTIFAAGNDASTVSGLDTANCTIKRTIDAGGPVHGLAVAAVGSAVTNTTGNQLWVSAGKAVSSFDTVSGKKLGSVDIPAGPTYLSIPPGAAVYVTTSEGSVVAIGLNKREVIPLVSGGQYGPMDFDEITGEVYVPDKAHHQLVVLTPVNPGFTIPHEPNRTIKLAEAPQSIAITSDGQLGFSALAGGKVAMLDIPGRQAITTFDVGGDPHFIITGLYPPAVGTTPQQANILTTLLTIAGYVLVVAVLVVPILLFRRYSKAQRKAWQTRAETNPDEEPTQILDERAEQTGQAKSQVDPRNEQ